MAILKNVEVHFARLDPKRPSKKLSPDNPTWEIQMRTSNKKQKEEWNALNIRTKAVREDPTDEESKILYYRANLKKKSIKIEKANGVETRTPAAPVSVVNGKQEDIDPNSLGNGSICNIRIFQHDYVYEGIPGIASVLMAVQVIKHVLYTPKAMEEFEDAETETIIPEDDDEEGYSSASGAAPNGKSDDEF